MRRWRLLLLPLAVIAEILILAACWVTAAVSPARAARMVHWATHRLPDLAWYRGE